MAYYYINVVKYQQFKVDYLLKEVYISALKTI